MRRKFPKMENTKFLMCEQARAELNNKISLIGLYPGDHIVFYPEEIGQYPYILASLSFVFIFGDGAGEFEVGFELLDPDNEQILGAPLKPLVLDAKAAGGLVVSTQNVQFNAEGQYLLVLNIDNRKYEFSFRVSSAEKQAGQQYA